MAVPIEEVNDAITFEQSIFSKIDESKTLEYCADSVRTVRINTRADRTKTDLDTQTDCCTCAELMKQVLV